MIRPLGRGCYPFARGQNVEMSMVWCHVDAAPRLLIPEQELRLANLGELTAARGPNRVARCAGWWNSHLVDNIHVEAVFLSPHLYYRVHTSS
jgi:hypothetical protein